jgi:hypothetical protein
MRVMARMGCLLEPFIPRDLPHALPAAVAMEIIPPRHPDTPAPTFCDVFICVWFFQRNLTWCLRTPEVARLRMVSRIMLRA